MRVFRSDRRVLKCFPCRSNWALKATFTRAITLPMLRQQRTCEIASGAAGPHRCEIASGAAGPHRCETASGARRPPLVRNYMYHWAMMCNEVHMGDVQHNERTANMTTFVRHTTTRRTVPCY
jgi:hypothetical protein